LEKEKPEKLPGGEGSGLRVGTCRGRDANREIKGRRNEFLPCLI